MILKNERLVSEVWGQFCKDPRLALIAIRHANKADSTPRGGLSSRGEDQVFRMMLATQVVIQDLTMKRLFKFLAANTRRNITTLVRLVPFFRDPERCISTPPSLDIPYLGPHDKDVETCARLATKLGITSNEAFALDWKKYGVKRLGETPEANHARIREGLKTALDREPNGVIVYCGNSPPMNAALGIPGVMAELEALFFSHKDGQFQLLDHVAPKFLD
ncbi:hypothetical protein A3H10_01065 [Candidatus Uhrbacteria bacterium RIFCSPLOWO2_12_FULL_46_10]|uniref:Phosphoglycerate mutase n=1 Tax=Candidatus Uhrbacteria bacterium RIFCSPLOWO2_01_FULL_47_25 TaxID=1802402 RepID=A0A1F7UWP9_9BACT|nr:MAG: hypothetical protein UX68_C0023G0022 [Parcubacteria group bacterium GW2011_GWA2_46_9]OGL60197.1 MAG: hypothetical protein A2752_01020 [Candidatus Uhrbacteria bacterium RIFCSPHIGHO2_01_FULL_46_23]OGL69661.1 MAG: hypothetical protein A3D60_02990 [Candidatus Uhrbacteria bacterium RIFCSPHIGHO2_02_FULL_47_29]OGL75891.1 MAG: hypothetical protein A3E96_04920 [Candidatus Uhrbacteria bacterium RIFCSPHIGHO2_12_FULL_46_13]OGL82722.1 MAG: hypothetical protein A2936_04005 [Candidatus Uhrbacteria bac